MARKKPSTEQQKSFIRRHKRLFVVLSCTIGIPVLLGLALWVTFQISPWPNALLIRDMFEKNDAKISQKQQKFVPANITQVENQQYTAGDGDAYLDVFYPTGSTGKLPTIVWVHGGAWVAGRKDSVDNYMRILAGHGFTTVSVNYSLAPEKQYPTPIVQLNNALGYVQRNAERLHIDDSNLLLAGDSAGSQIVAQMANIVTSDSYAKEISIEPQLPSSKLKGVLLNCGAYDLSLPDYNGSFGGFLRTVLWAYSGTRDFLNDSRLKTASVVRYVTPDFPPAFITAGNVDPLLSQSTELASRLRHLGVKTDALFYPPHYVPQLNHEYQFDLDTTEGKRALEQMIIFARQRARAQQ